MCIRVVPRDDDVRFASLCIYRRLSISRMAPAPEEPSWSGLNVHTGDSEDAGFGVVEREKEGGGCFGIDGA